MDKIIVDVYANDNGYSGDKYAYRDREGKIIVGKTKSAIAEAPSDTEDAPLFEGKRYYLGEMALMADTNEIKNIVDYKEHEKFLPLSIYNSLTSNNIDHVSIKKLMIGLSLAQKNYIKDFTKRASKFQVDNEKFDFQDKIFVMPQGAAAKYAIDDIYYKNEKDAVNYAIYDIGMLSIDNASVVQGKCRFENSNGTIHDGIIKIITELEKYISNTYGDMVSHKEAQEFLILGKYVSFGEEYDLTDVISQLKIDYTKFIAQKMLQTQKNVLKKFPKIYIIGGGAYYIDKDLLVSELRVGKDKIVIPDNPEYLNAIGYLIFGEME